MLPRKFSDHSQLEEYLKISNLSQSWRNVHDAITDFEKHISFDKGNYVFHRSWGIGKISNIDNDIFIIDFASKPKHKMSLKMAVSALEILQPEHIWVLKATLNKDGIKKRIKEDLPWALKMVIRSFNNVVDMKKIKAELVPSILTPGEWAKWSTDARKILKTDPQFGNLPEKMDKFIVRDNPITYEEKTFNKFKAEKNFFGRVQTIQEFLLHADPDSDYFAEMFAYFSGFALAHSVVTELVVASYLMVQKLVAQFPYLNPNLEYSFVDLFNQIEDVEDLFVKINDNDLKKTFLIEVRNNLDNWSEVFSNLFLFYQSKYIIDELVADQRWDLLRTLCDNIVSRAREYREAFIWVAKNLSDEDWFHESGIKTEKILIGMIHLLDITYREISNKRDVSLNRKLNKQIQDFLFKESRLIDFIMETGEEAITRLFTLLEDVRELDPSIKIQLKHTLKEKYPDYQFMGEAEKETVNMGLLVTRQGYESKQRELRRILENEIPDNSKEIGVAMAKGDLRENAEYKAAIERQELLKASAQKLQEELQSAQIFDESLVDIGQIAFGTKVQVSNSADDIEEYTILGPWESEPSKQVISYLSPLGLELCNHKIGESLVFTINDQEFKYTVKNIEKAEATYFRNE